MENKTIIRMTSSIGNTGILSLSAMALCTLALVPAAKATSLLSNGGFESTTNGPGQFDSKTQAIGWTSPGYNFIFGAGTADTTGSDGDYGPVQLWGPNNGSNNGLPASSPDGGNYAAADGAFGVAAISQIINGLIPNANLCSLFLVGGGPTSWF